MAVGINIVTGFDGKGIEKAITEFNKLQTTADKTKFVIQKAALPAAAALAGIAAAAGLATKAAMEDAQEQSKLAQTLRNATGATNEQIAAVEKQISGLMKVSTFSDTELRPALANLVQATQDVSRSQELMGLAMDISVATGVPLINVTDALAKAENGQMRALSMLAPVVRENVKEGASLGEVYNKLGEVFGGAALQQTKTAAGQMQMFKNQVNELAESFGAILLPALQTILPVMTAFAGFAERNRVVIMALTGVIAVLATGVLLATGYIKLMNMHTRLMEIQAYKNATAMMASSKAVAAFGTALKGVGGIIAVLGLAEAIFAIGNAASGADRKIDQAAKGMIVSLSNLKGSSKQDSSAIVEDFANLAKEIDSKLKMGDVFGDFGREFQLTIGGAKVDIEDFDEAFKKVMETSPQAAERLIAALKTQLAVTDPTSQAYKDLSDAIARYASQVAAAKGAQDALNAGFAQTLTLADVARQAFLNSTQAKYDDLRMNNANAESLKKFRQEVFNISSAVGKAGKSIQDRLGDYRSAIEGLNSAKASLADASQAVIDAQQKVKDSAHGVTQAERNAAKAAEDLAEAVKGVAKAQAATAAARKSYQDSLQATAKAQEKLEKATSSVAKAQDAFNAAVRGYGAGSKQGKQATRQLADAQQETERSSYDLEKAHFAVTEAEAELLAVRGDAEATAQDVREAEIALAEAKLAVIDAQERQVDSQDALTQATDNYDQMLNGVRADSQLYKDLLADLNAAKEQEREAIDAVTQARERETEMLANIAEALDGEAEAATRVEDAKWALAEAEREIEAAKRDQAAAIRDVAKAQLDEATALYEVAKAQKEVNTTRAAAPAAGAALIDKQFEAIAETLGAVAAGVGTSEAVAAFTGGGGGGIGGSLFEATMFAKGGIVTGPTLGIVGEAGPEAVIPLNQASGLGTTINVTVNAGMGTNGDAVGKAVVDALRQYQRHNGAIPITVA